MEIDLTKSFEDNLKAAGTSEKEVIQAVVALDHQKGARRRHRHRGGVEGDEAAAPAPAPAAAEDSSDDDDYDEKPLTLKQRIAIAKAAVISTAVKYARHGVSASLLIATHKAFTQHLCNPTIAGIAKSASWVPIVSDYSQQCDSAQATYAKAMSIAVLTAGTILLPQIEQGLTILQIPADLIATILNKLDPNHKSKKKALAKEEAGEEEAAEEEKPAPRGRRGKGRKKTKRVVRKSGKTKSKKSARRH